MPGSEKAPQTPQMGNYRERLRRQTNNDIQNSLNWLRGKGGLNTDPGITRQPEKLDNGAVVFGYKNTQGEYEIVTRKEGSTYRVRIKKRINNQWYTQRNEGNETFDFVTNDKTIFNHQLGFALDKIIGRNRDRLPMTGGIVYTLLNGSNNGGRNVDVNRNSTDIKKKPIDLKYTEKNKEKKVEINFPENNYSVEGRVTRCLRWASITDAVENRYGIPRGLLMALMAQEGRGDPTVINQKSSGKCDGGAGLIHMQAINAANFGLNTLPRSNNGMIDYQHGEKLKKAKKDKDNDLKELSKLDDRFNPVLSVDASARFLLNEYNKLPEGKDRWLHAINKYAGRGMQDYGYSVVVYRTTINSIRNKSMPTFTEEIEKVKKGKVSAKVNQQRERTDYCIERTTNAIKKLSIKLDGDPVSYNEYLKYQKLQCDNYGLSDYVKFNREHPYVR